jgi:HEAT repeat protein
MSPLTVFVRALLKSSAICFGVAIALVEPSFDGSPSRPAVAHQSPVQEAIDGLIDALKDPDPGVRRNAAVALGELRSARAVPALIDATRDERSDVRSGATAAIRQITKAHADAAQALPELGRAFGTRLTRRSSALSRGD